MALLSNSNKGRGEKENPVRKQAARSMSPSPASPASAPAPRRGASQKTYRKSSVPVLKGNSETLTAEKRPAFGRGTRTAQTRAPRENRSAPVKFSALG